MRKFGSQLIFLSFPFIENAREQTYTGTVLVAVNPYENLYIYSKNLMNMYKQKKITELPPHIFAIANIAYNKLIEENRNQCILVAGESGAGKTWVSSHLLMRFP